MRTTTDIQDHRRVDRGFTLVEILIVIVIIGVLSTVTVFAVRGIADRGEDASCLTDERTLEEASEMFFANNFTDTIPATGAGDDRFEQTLVDAGIIREVSVLYTLAEDGSATRSGGRCAET